MPAYTPPFSLSPRMLMLTTQIAEKAEKIRDFHYLDTHLFLRRNNRIRSVHSSLAIEANSLSLDEVRSVIRGQAVIGPEKEIQEVQNAYRAYELLGSFDPYSIDELKRLHGIMTEKTVQESGIFRSGDEGVFRGNRCIFIAPPPQLVPEQMEALFGWMKGAAQELHPLILSSVFHYEFVFIHPFADGNGRMARLWQTALLGTWNTVFYYLPLESHIHEFQDEYYDAIAACNAQGSSEEFILFMLERICDTLNQLLANCTEDNAAARQPVRKLLSVMEYGVTYTALQLMERLGLKSRDHFRKLYLKPALESKLIERSNPDVPTSRNQSYIRR